MPEPVCREPVRAPAPASVRRARPVRRWAALAALALLAVATLCAVRPRARNRVP